MATTELAQLKWRRGTAAEWTFDNPVLGEGEPAYETDTGNYKIGDGTTAWSSLSYHGGLSATQMHALTAKTTPADSDEVHLLDSAASYISKKLTWANIKVGIKSYYDAVASTLTNKTIDLASNTVTMTKAQLNTAVSDADVATLAGSEALTNKDLTGSGNTFPSQAIEAHAATSKATPVDADEIPIVDSAASNVLKKLTWANLKATAKTYFDTLYATIASPTFTGTVTIPSGAVITSANENYPLLKSPQEVMNISATAATGTVQFDTKTQGILYYTTNASGNVTLNVRGDSGTTLDSLMAIGSALTIEFWITNGATPYYISAVTIDGNSVTPKVTAAISSGNASAIDIYSLTIVKTASATFTVLMTQSKFA